MGPEEITSSNVLVLQVLKTVGEETLTIEGVTKKYNRMYPPRRIPQKTSDSESSFCRRFPTEREAIEKKEEINIESILNFLCKEKFLKSSLSKDTSKGEVLEYSLTEFGRGRIKNKKDTRRR